MNQGARLVSSLRIRAGLKTQPECNGSLSERGMNRYSNRCVNTITGSKHELQKRHQRFLIAGLFI